MHLTAFQSDKGDCLLLTNTAGTTNILVDGGMSVSYNAHVAAAMGKLEKAKKALDSAGIEIPFPHMQVLLEETPAVERLSGGGMRKAG